MSGRSLRSRRTNASAELPDGLSCTSSVLSYTVSFFGLPTGRRLAVSFASTLAARFADPALDEGGDDGFQLGLDLLPVEVLAQGRIGGEHGGDQPAAMRPHFEGRDAGSQPRARRSGADGA